MKRRNFIKAASGLFVPMLLLPRKSLAQGLNRSAGYRGALTPIAAAGGGGSSSLLTGLQYYYKLEDTSDSSGNGSTLTNNNTATFVAGKVNNCGNFVSASSQSLSCASNAFNDITTNDFTIAGWVKSSTTGTNKTLINKGDGFTGSGIAIYIDTGNNINATFGTNISAVAAIQSATNVCDGAWHFWCVTGARTSNMVIQVDTTASSNFNISGIQDSATNALSFFIGKYNSGILIMNGNVDELGYWTRVLTSTEIACLRNTGSGTTYPFTGLC